MSEPREIHYEASGHRFAALAWGSEDPGAPLALCLHGFPDTPWTWRHLGPALAATGRRVVAPYMRGYGPTGPVPGGPYSVGALAADLLAARDALGGDERTVVVGHDWGAAAVYPATDLHSDRFARAVVLAIPPEAVMRRLARAPREALGSTGMILRQLRNTWYMAFNQLPQVSERSLLALAPRLWRAWSPGYDPSWDVAKFREAVPTPAHRSAVLGYYRALFQPWRRGGAAYAETQRQVRRAVPRVPFLYLHGADDGCILPVWAERSRGLLREDAEIDVVPGAGHFLQLERPEAVNARILAFLGEGGGT